MTHPGAELFRTIAYCAEQVAQAIEDEDSIAGTLASQGFLDNLAALPRSMRDELLATLTTDQEEAT